MDRRDSQEFVFAVCFEISEMAMKTAHLAKMGKKYKESS